MMKASSLLTRALQLATTASLLAIAQPASAILTYTIYESGGNVVVDATGSINRGAQDGMNLCGTNGGIKPSGALICTGNEITYSIPYFNITGSPTSFGTSGFLTASSTSGLRTILDGFTSKFSIDPTYVNGDPITATATFNGKTLASLGITSTGLLGTWTLSGGDTIKVVVNAPTAVPGPLPLLGAGAAFGWSRRLRRRVALASASHPQG